MKRAIVLEHAPFEGPGRIAPLLVELGYTLDVRTTYAGAPVPAQLAPGEVLVVMGGPMGVGDLDQPELGFLREEVALLRRCIADNVPVLGVCLGAQLLAHAAGGAVGRMTDAAGNRVYEVGWAPITLHPTGDDDPILGGVPPELPMLHWHGDHFELPAGARRLASTATCPQQGFQLGTRQFGVQFHPEVELEHIEAFLNADTEFFERANGPGGIERLRHDTATYLHTARAAGERLLGNILAAMTA